jgi:hypothetical protein
LIVAYSLADNFGMTIRTASPEVIKQQIKRTETQLAKLKLMLRIAQIDNSENRQCQSRRGHDGK